MSGKNAKLIRKYVKKASQKQLKTFGLDVYQIISNPYKYLKNVYKSTQRAHREQFKKKLI